MGIRVTKELHLAAVAETFAVLKAKHPQLSDEFHLQNAENAIYSSYEHALSAPKPVFFENHLRGKAGVSEQLVQTIDERNAKVNKKVQDNFVSNLKTFFTISGVSEETAQKIVETDIIQK